MRFHKRYYFIHFHGTKIQKKPHIHKIRISSKNTPPFLVLFNNNTKNLSFNAKKHVYF